MNKGRHTPIFVGLQIANPLIVLAISLSVVSYNFSGSTEHWRYYANAYFISVQQLLDPKNIIIFDEMNKVILHCIQDYLQVILIF